ncbi:hypothetical protein SC206_15970 [Rouxiella sp. T17]|uniref:hypothetical protein n=1 Tax=Rouxiella sp. T17 TaxID=3085684 RepID=UPI002FCC5314
MKIFIVFIFILFFSSCSLNNSKSTEQALFDKVIAASKDNDGKNLSDVDYDRVLKYISKGKTRWITLYPILNKKPFLDTTFFQEGLNIAMAYALPKSPLEVLKYVDLKNIDDICGAPFIETTFAEKKRYLLKSIKAINKVTSGGQKEYVCIFNLNIAFVSALFKVK